MNLSKLKINLIPKEQVEEKTLGKFLNWSLSFGRYIIVGTEIIVLLAFFSRFKLDRQLTDLHEEIVQKETIVKFNSEFEKEARKLQKQLEEIKEISAQHDFALRLLDFLGKNMPKEVTINKLSLSQANISLTGASLSTNSFIDFLARIRRSEKFNQIILQDLSQKGEEGLEFRLTGQVSKEKFF